MSRRIAAIDPSERREVSKALEEQLGFDPFRVLDNTLPGNQDAEMQFRSMVGGMNRLEVVRGWKAAERRLGRGPDGGPREAVIRLLEQREEWLEEHGELEDRLPNRTPEELRERSRTLYDAKQLASDDEADDGPLTADEKLARIRAGDHPVRDETSVVTDGGEQA